MINFFMGVGSLLKSHLPLYFGKTPQDLLHLSAFRPASRDYNIIEPRGHIVFKQPVGLFNNSAHAVPFNGTAQFLSDRYAKPVCPKPVFFCVYGYIGRSVTLADLVKPFKQVILINGNRMLHLVMRPNAL